MAILGLIFIGLLFGILLSSIAVAFVIIRSGGPLKESLFGSDPGRLPAFGGAKRELAPNPEGDKRAGILLEENRVMQRLLDQTRVEREEQIARLKASQAETEALRGQLSERDAGIQELRAALREAQQRHDELFAQLGERGEELARVRTQLKDAVVELDVTTSGASFTTQQIDLLQKERDELAILLDELRSRRQASRPTA